IVGWKSLLRSEPSPSLAVVSCGAGPPDTGEPDRSIWRFDYAPVVRRIRRHTDELSVLQVPAIGAVRRCCPKHSLAIKEDIETTQVLVVRPSRFLLDTGDSRFGKWCKLWLRLREGGEG